MRLLLDTHVALWAITDDPRLPEMARSMIGDRSNQIYVSAASIWEITIKHAVKRDDMPVSGTRALAFFRSSGYELLDITARHAASVETLPSLHADPFDRLIVAQAIAEPLRLMTRDAMVARYSDTIIRV